jgi:hypothetical protein
MNIEKEIKELDKNRRQSGKAIPIDAGLLVVMALGLWILNKVSKVPALVTWGMLAITGSTVTVDILNYFYCGRKLRKLRSDLGPEAKRAEPS